MEDLVDACLGIYFSNYIANTLEFLISPLMEFPSAGIFPYLMKNIFYFRIKFHEIRRYLFIKIDI